MRPLIHLHLHCIFLVLLLFSEVILGTSVQSHFTSSEGYCQDKRSCQILNKKKCWGYEPDCDTSDRYSHPTCTKLDRRWAQTLEDQQQKFWEQGDFGYLRKKMDTMMQLCTPQNQGDSSLSCTKNLWYCRATNLYLDFRRYDFHRRHNRYHEDVFKEGEVGGHCNFNKELHKQQGENKSPLQSWFAELQHFTSLPYHPMNDGACDVVIDKPTMVIKLDAGVNMYHHFCDFVNLYASQHINGSFSTDVNILVWDTSDMHYADFFSEMWMVFSKHPLLRLNSFQGKRVCLKDAVFSLLARMIFGLYYNMPLVPNCHGSGLFHSFTHHTLERLGIIQDEYEEDEFRITLIERKTQYRNILNQDELIGAMKSVPNFKVKVVHYNREIPFLDQLKVTHNTDIMIGMHGAGLTHLLFLPDWAVIFEIYNTEDPDCYGDLARLRVTTPLSVHMPSSQTMASTLRSS
ncbi:EGF domain-specific O-linked N-acetylglucosamine transferase isoform X2 [Nematostella vectensis]|uniref:EGF domain-specific O-linked N-acetylglucosamine transferase isoform X2 n=1 Tax=Nematostella vectensis TaxID=45351 RepID=UPI0020779449|nr:EGF domain-specific O-linked N-acetylglucosamine transferase isoform X2 [Nematostella vectensis]